MAKFGISDKLNFVDRIRAINDRRQITLPPSVLQELGVGEGAYFAIHTEKGRIVLEPRAISDKGLGADEWALLGRMVKRQVKAGEVTTYQSPKAARKHLDRFR